MIFVKRDLFKRSDGRLLGLNDIQQQMVAEWNAILKYEYGLVIQQREGVSVIQFEFKDKDQQLEFILKYSDYIS